MTMPTARGSLIGFLVGIIPGAGGAISSIIAYNEERRVSKTPERFGKGAIEGIAAPESANNAVVGGSLLPMLSLGIPGSATAAILMGALTIHGLQPGPDLFREGQRELVYSLFASQLLANVVMLFIGLALIKQSARIVKAPKPLLAPTIVTMAVVGSYSIGGSMVDVSIALSMGLLGFILRKLDVPIGPVVLSFVLGAFVESNLRRMGLLYSDDYGSLVREPIFAALSVGVLLVILYPVARAIWRKSRSGREAVGRK